MAYREHVLLQFGGDMPDGEIWSCGMRLNVSAQNMSTSYEFMEEWVLEHLNDVTNDVNAWVTREDSYLSNQVKLRFVKLNPIGTNGRYMNEGGTFGQYFTGGAPPTGIGQAVMPNQVAVAVSLHTDKTRGLAARGRFFTPALAATVLAGTGKIVSGKVVAMLGSAVTLIQDINNQEGIDLANVAVGVFSKVAKGGQDQVWNPVTKVSVGDRFDIQRRRGNAQEEVRMQAGVS